MKPPAALPIDDLLGDLSAALDASSSAVVIAAPGAGKTTRIPLHLRSAPWLQGRKIVLLEPRRLAARMSALRMAGTLGEGVGETVGYRVRLDTKVSVRTRIEVVTEGILTRRLQSDPEIADVGLLIFDEFHERSLDADLGLALALDVQRALRPDLKILVMSATLNDGAVADLLGGAPVIFSSHRPFPVETRYLDAPAGDDLAREMAAAVRRVLAEEEGSILAFLPGEGEIRRCAALLEDAVLPQDCLVAPLFGALSPDAQARAIAPPPPGARKVVLATTIAETSLTIEGVRVVIDCGYKRAPRFDPGRGMARLVSVRVSRAAAEQRRGRAGRLGPGVCYRLWTEPEDRGLKAYDDPEMLEADLASLVLDLAGWGVADPLALAWLTPPPAGAFSQAVDLLRRLGALDGGGRITAEGKAMAALPLHPRLAHMVHRGAERGKGGLACDLAALLAERDMLIGARDPDIRTRLDVLARESDHNGRINHGALARVRAASKQLRGLAGAGGRQDGAVSAGFLLALAYPDRIAQRRGGDGRYRLSGGGGAFLDPSDPLAAQEFLAVAELDGAAREGRIYLAAALMPSEIEQAFADVIEDAAEVSWDPREQLVVARRTRRLGAVVLETRPLSNPDPEALQAAMNAGVRQMGLEVLPWTPASRALRERVALLRRIAPQEGWPDLTDMGLLETLDDWLTPYLAGMTRRSHLARLDMEAALRALLPWPLPQRLDELAPTHIAVPSGSRIAVEYGAGMPALFVKLQEVFGLEETPTVAGGRVPVTLHLLSPAQRPIAVTADLRSFWANVYPQVRGEMRGRYPRHIWPDDPVAATATRRSIKPRGT